MNKTPTHNYQKSRFYVFSKAQVEEMIEVEGQKLTGNIPSDPALFRMMAEAVLKKLGKRIAHGSTCDLTGVVVTWPKSGSTEGVLLEVQEKWRNKLPNYLDLLRA